MPEEYLHKDKEELYAELQQLKAAISKKEAELAELKRLVFGRKSERFVPDQAPTPRADALNAQHIFSVFVRHRTFISFSFNTNFLRVIFQQAQGEA